MIALYDLMALLIRRRGLRSDTSPQVDSGMWVVLVWLRLLHMVR